MDLVKAKKVCSQWKNVIDETIGIRRYVGIGGRFWKHGNWKPLHEISTLGISHCYFSNLRDGDKEIVTFARPYLVQHVEFDDYVDTTLFKALTNPLINLTSMTLHISSLSFISLDFNGSEYVESLKTLRTSMYPFSSKHFGDYSMKTVYDNLRVILGKKFRVLEKIDLELPLFLDKEVEMFNHLLDFIKSHSDSLVTLNLLFGQIWNVERNDGIARGEVETIEVQDILHEFETANKVLIDPIGKTKICNFSYVVDDRYAIVPSSMILRSRLINKTDLRKFHYLCWEYIEIPPNILSKSKESLIELSLTVNDLISPVDGKCFEHLSNLLKLSLEADGQIGFDDIADAPRLRNMEKLPKKITNLSFRNVYLEHFSIDFAVRNLPLQSLILINVGKVDTLGMTIPTLIWTLAKNKTLQKLKVKGLNEACYKVSFRKLDTSMNPESEELICSTCQNHSSPMAEDSYKEDTSVSIEDIEYLKALFEESNMGTKMIPLIKRTKHGWTKTKL